MKLDRNINKTGLGKYALLKLRNVGKPSAEITTAFKVLADAGILDWGDTPEAEFFVIRLKDRYAREALIAYAMTAAPHDRQYAEEVSALAARSGTLSPHCKTPD